MHYIEPPVAVQRADMDFPGAESDLEAERDIKTKQKKQTKTPTLGTKQYLSWFRTNFGRKFLKWFL